MDTKSHRGENSFSLCHSSKQLNIPDFCDMKLFEQMMKDWATSTGLATVAVGSDGAYVSGCYNFTDFCQHLTRKSPEGLRRCIECDKKGTGTYLCHAGLVDFAAPITLADGTLVGNIVGGQVLPKEPDEARFRATARELGIDEDIYIEALRKVNVRSPEEIEASARLLSNVINMFVRTSYAAQRHEASLTERARIISSLSKIYFGDYYIDLSTGEFIELDATDGLHAVSGSQGMAACWLENFCTAFVDPAYVSDFRAFTELSTLPVRLGRRQSLTYEFIFRGLGWCRATFIASSHDQKGLVSHVIYALQHIQEEKEKELQNRQILKAAADEANRANQAKSEFLSNMSHDMRTPLNGIVGFTNLALHSDDIRKKQDYLTKIDSSSRLMLELVNDVLDMSKVVSDKMELHPQVFDARELFNEVMTSIRHQAAEKDIDFKVNISALKYPFIFGDKLRHHQILLNLLSNALKYTPAGGTIWFTEEDLDLPLHGCNARVTVKDTGIGMGKDFQKRMFEPFAQEHRDEIRGTQGTGLGLSIVKQIVLLMGGTIEVDSRLGQGSTFTVYLPLQWVEGSRSQVREQPEDSLDLAGRYVLLAEDNDLNAEIAETILQERSHVITERATDGLQALRAFQRSEPFHFSAILMDLRMPNMSGIEAAKAIRALDRPDAGRIPIIALTADAFTSDVQACLQSQMNGHVAKPISPDRLLQVLSRQIRKVK